MNDSLYLSFSSHEKKGDIDASNDDNGYLVNKKHATINLSSVSDRYVLFIFHAGAREESIDA